MNKKILLLYPNDDFDSYPAVRPAMGLAYIATNIYQNGFEVRLMDLRIPSNRNCLPSVIDAFRPNFVCFSILSSTVKKVMEWINLIKKRDVNIKILVGGPEVTLFPLKIMENKTIDFGIQGEGDFVVSEFLKLYDNGLSSCKELPGLVYRKNGVVIANRPAMIDNLDKISFPRWSLVNLKDYCKKISNIEFPLCTSRGCPYKCSFCTSSKLQIKYRVRSVENILGELEYLKKEFALKRFQILDDNFALVKKRVLDLCQEMIRKRLNLKWVVGQGISVGSTDYEMFKLMKEAGCLMVSIGVESVSQKVLDNIGKKTTIEKIERTIAAGKKAGLMVKAFFINGLPGATPITEMESIEFFKKNKIDLPRYSNAIPFPGTTLYEWVSENGRFLIDTNTMMSKISHTPGMLPSVNITPAFETDDFSAEERINTYKTCMNEAEKWSLEMKFGSVLGYIFFHISSFQWIRKLGLRILYYFNKL